MAGVTFINQWRHDHGIPQLCWKCRQNLASADAFRCGLCHSCSEGGSVSVHRDHPDIHDAGLVDGCERCIDLAEDPRQLDARMITRLAEADAAELTDLDIQALSTLQDYVEDATFASWQDYLLRLTDLGRP